MNLPKVIAGTAVLVLAAFWAVLLLDLLTTIGYFVVLVSPFFVLLAVGSYGIIDGLAGGFGRSKGGSIRGGGRVDALAMTVLRMVSQGKTKQEIAAATAVSLVVIEKKMEALSRAGFLFENALSEKGYDAVRGSA
ncbi:MAG: hypothetical protein JRM80_05710 [Nitrososphaerota archaeon]|nr:hypothetical protein [Nitrososphaerota archaeon]